MITIAVYSVLCVITLLGVAVLMRATMDDAQKLKQMKIIFLLLALSIVTHELKSHNYVTFSILKTQSVFCEDNFYAVSESFTARGGDALSAGSDESAKAGYESNFDLTAVQNPAFQVFYSAQGNKGAPARALRAMVDSLIGKYPIYYTRLERPIASESDLAYAFKVAAVEIFEATVSRLVKKGLRPVIVIDNIEKALGSHGCRLCDVLVRLYNENPTVRVLVLTSDVQYVSDILQVPGMYAIAEQKEYV